MKAGNKILRFDTARHAFGDVEVRSYLVHEDGFMRVPVLVLGDLVVRGYTEALYAEALTPPLRGDRGAPFTGGTAR